MTSKKRLLLLSAYNPRDVSKWSGTLTSIFLSLEGSSSDVSVGYLRGGLGALDVAARGLNKALRYLGLNLDCRFSTTYAILAGMYLSLRLCIAKSAVLLVIAGSNYLAYLRTSRKIIYISDATFREICDLYPQFRVFPRWLKLQGDRNEARSLNNAQFIIYPSAWAADSAQLHYGVSRERIHILTFGPNIPESLIKEHYLPKSLDRNEIVNFIFVSADWNRKNGDMAVEICRLLIEAGIKTRLIIIGDAPVHVADFKFVDYRGFLDKSDARQLHKLCDAYQEANFLLLPTTADASPIVFAEAQAFGIPSVTYDVGGTSGAIVDGQTGVLLPLGAPASRFAERLKKYIERPECYLDLSRQCRDRYLRSANWKNWSDLIFQLVRENS